MAQPPPVFPPIGLRLTRTARAVSQAFEREMGHAGGSAAAWQVLLLVRRQQWDTQSEMAGAMGRDATNRRVQHVELTDKGSALFQQLRAAAGRHDERLRTNLTAEETTQLAGLLDKVHASIDPRNCRQPEERTS